MGIIYLLIMGNNIGEVRSESEGVVNNLGELASKQSKVKERFVLLSPFVTN